MMPGCGTAGGSAKHYANGERPCDPCREAKNKYQRERMREIRAGREPAVRVPVARRVLDVLETDAGWMSADTLAFEIEERFGVGTLDSVRQALYRLLKRGRVQRRTVGDVENAGMTADEYVLSEWRISWEKPE